MNMAFWLAPLIRIGKAKHWKETFYVILPPNTSTAVRWGPRQYGRVYHVYKLRLGTPRNYNTGEVTYNDKIYLWMRGKEMEWHWHPLLESVTGTDIPMDTTATQRDPMIIEYHNDTTDTTVVFDMTFHIVEYNEVDERLIQEFMRGFINYFLGYGKIGVVPTPERMIKKLIRW